MYQKFKHAEASLQNRMEPIGYSVKIEPISGADLYYSDGLVSSCYGKVILKKNMLEYQIFFPYYCLNLAVSKDVEHEMKVWIAEVQSS